MNVNPIVVETLEGMLEIWMSDIIEGEEGAEIEVEGLTDFEVMEEEIEVLEIMEEGVEVLANKTMAPWKGIQGQVDITLSMLLIQSKI